MRSQLDSLAVKPRDLADMAPGPYVLFSEVGVFFLQDYVVQPGARRVYGTTPEGYVISVPANNATVLSAELCEFSTGADVMRAQHESERAMREFTAQLRAADGDNGEDEDVPGQYA